ncbi:MAG: HNH endonuclease [Chloroflexota bacterium]
MAILHLFNRPDVYFLIDDQDLNLVTGYHWRLNASGYVVASVKQDKDWRPICLHRLLLGTKPGYQVDHINHDKLDNRRQNLRWVTPQQNTRNRRLLKSSRTGFIGVSQHGNRFHAYLKVNNRNKFLGSYETAETAALVRDAYARQIDEEHFVLNFPNQPVTPEIDAALQAVLNPSPKPVKSKSRYRGVCWVRGRWRAQISVKARDLHLGYFASEMDAAKAYDKAAKQYHGRRAHLSFADEGAVRCEADLIPTDGMRPSLNAV